MPDECVLNGKRVPCSSTEKLDLDDKSKFTCVQNVALLDIHKDEVRGDIDEDLLNLLKENTERRLESGKFVPITIGHTPNDPDSSEDKYPEVIGFAKNFKIGKYEDRACLLYDHCIAKEKVSYAQTFPFWSAERVHPKKGFVSPERNYIDCISLLRRKPERSFGVIKYEEAIDKFSETAFYCGSYKEIDYKKEKYMAIDMPVPATGGIDPATIAAIVQGVCIGMKEVMKEFFDNNATDLDEEVPLEEEMPPVEGEMGGAEEEVGAAEDEVGAAEEAVGGAEDEVSAEEEEAEEYAETPGGPAFPGGQNTNVKGQLAGKKQSGPRFTESEKMSEVTSDVVIEKYNELVERFNTLDSELHAERKKREAAEKKNEALSVRVVGIEFERRKARYSEALSDLVSKGYIFDKESEADTLARMTPDNAQKHLDKIEKYYHHEPIDQELLNLANPNGAQDGELTMGDDVLRYAQENNCWNGIECVKRYAEDKKNGKIPYAIKR